jgi:uncharacterized protein YfaS (alpha-2-macroglobulin family)
MRTRQNGEGGFGYWTATPNSERFVSAYAMLFLLEAQERGRPVPADMLSLGNGYIQSLAADESDGSLAGLRERAFAIYLLTRQGNVTTNALSSVEKALDERYAKTWRSDVTAAWLGASLKLMREDKEGARLIAGPEKVLARNARTARSSSSASTTRCSRTRSRCTCCRSISPSAPRRSRRTRSRTSCGRCARAGTTRSRAP